MINLSKNLRNVTILPVLAGALLVLSGCSPSPDGDGGNAGGVSGLEMATTMSVVTPTGTGVISASPALIGNFLPKAIADTTAIPANSDYFLDIVNTNVWDESMGPLDTVNTILCIIAQARVGDMVNTGPYVALINLDRCEQGQNQTNANGATGVKYEKWTVESVRAFSNSPQYVSIWWPKFEDSKFPNGALMAQAVISSAVSNDNPFGSFSFNFKLINKLMPTDPPYFTGSLRTVARSDNQPQFEFISEAGDAFNQAAGYNIEAANALFDDVTGTIGVAKTFVWNSSLQMGALVTQQDTYRLAFNANNFLKSKQVFIGGTTTNTDTCLDRTVFDTQVWRYNIYDAATGDRIKINSSFSFNYMGQYGNVGYNGLWYEDDTVLIPDTAVLNRELPDGTTTPVDMHLSNGKMTRKTANIEQVTNLVGQQFYFWGLNPVAADPGASGYDAWSVKVLNIDIGGGVLENRFVVTDGINFTSSGGVTFTPETGTTDLARSLTTVPQFFWSDTLGGSVVFVDNTPVNNLWQVTYYVTETVTPADSAFTGSTISMNCYDRCPIGNLTQADIDAAAIAGGYNDLFYAPSVAALPYTLTATVDSKLVLTDDSIAAPLNVVSTVGLDLTAINGNQAIQSGPMVLNTVVVVGPPTGVYNETVSMNWTTGDDYKDRLITVTPQGSSNVIVFDQPIRFDYTHDAVNELNASNAASPYIGSKMLLNYGGPGNLNGFPYSQVPGTNRWVSPVVLNDAVLLTDVNSNTYITKGTQREQTMQEISAPTTVCDVLDTSLADALRLPRGSDITPVGITLLDKPTVTAPPAVIDGELQ